MLPFSPSPLAAKSNGSEREEDSLKFISAQMKKGGKSKKSIPGQRKKRQLQLLLPNLLSFEHSFPSTKCWKGETDIYWDCAISRLSISSIDGPPIDGAASKLAVNDFSSLLQTISTCQIQTHRCHHSRTLTSSSLP